MNCEVCKECKECKKDWTKCGTCPITMQWVKEQRDKQKESEVKQ